MKNVYLLGLLLSLISCNANIDNAPIIQTDTVYVTQIDTVNIIEGNHMLPKSRKTSISCDVMAIWLDSVTVSECKNQGEPNFDNDDWTYIQDSDDYFHVEVSAHAVCGSNFLYEIQLLGKGNLDLQFYPYNSRADCYCCYSFNYYFRDDRSAFDPEEDAWLEVIKSISVNGKNKKPLP